MEGIDPSQQRQVGKLASAERAENTFEKIGREWFTKYAGTWDPAHAGRILSRLERDIFPLLGGRPISDVEPPELYGAASSVPLQTTSSSGLPVSYVVQSGPGRIAGSTPDIEGAGQIVVTAMQEGNNTYASAAPVSQTLTVGRATLIVAGPVFSLTYGASIDLAQFPPPTITGFVGGDTQTSLITGAPVYTTSATGTPDAGVSHSSRPRHSGAGTNRRRLRALIPWSIRKELSPLPTITSSLRTAQAPSLQQAPSQSPQPPTP